MTDLFLRLVQALRQAGVRFVVIGVWGANCYAPTGSSLFTTFDRDLFLPLDAANLQTAWSTCEGSGMTLWSGNEALDQPRDLWLAERVVGKRALTQARLDREGLAVDLSLVMTGFTFEQAWAEHREFEADGVRIPVARLAHIVDSKRRTDRPKDRLFLATHAEALLRMMSGDQGS
jgi:hypothetical protein